LTSAPILSTQDLDRPLLVICDASSYGIGCVLAQTDEEGSELPIAYMSEKMAKEIRNYSVTEMECLALIKGIKKLRAYIERKKFGVITDHSSLQWLMQQKDLSGRLEMFYIKFQGFSFCITRHNGTQTVVADTLLSK